MLYLATKVVIISSCPLLAAISLGIVAIIAKDKRIPSLRTIGPLHDLLQGYPFERALLPLLPILLLPCRLPPFRILL